MPKTNSIKTISDPLLEPFFITRDDYCFTVNERIIPNKAHFRSKEGGKEYFKPQGYYPKLEQALVKIAELKIYTEKELNSLQKLINKYLDIQIEIKTFINESKV